MFFESGGLSASLLPFAWQALAEALKHNKAMTTLYLRLNEIGAEGGKARVGVGGAWWTFCLLVAFAWQALAEALRHNSTLTTLNLEYNNIGDEGVKARVGVLRAWWTFCLLVAFAYLCVAGSC